MARAASKKAPEGMKTDTDERAKAIDNAIAQIDRSYGKGAVMRLGDRVRAPINVIPTGSTALDVALGIGGVPRGRAVGGYGPGHAGNTHVARPVGAYSQKDTRAPAV